MQLLEVEGDLLLIRATGEDVRMEAPTAFDRALLASIDGQSTAAELANRYGDQFSIAWSQLSALGLVDDAADEESLDQRDRLRFDRLLRYFTDAQLADGPRPSECFRRLRNARVTVLGLGGLGGRVALELAACGVGSLRLVDGDRVEISNLNRQIQYGEADVGCLKVEIAAARLRAFNSSMELVTHAKTLTSQTDISAVIAGADLVIDAVDTPAHEIEFWCNAACFERNVPYISMSHFPPFARVGPLFVPGVTGCFACQDAEFRRNYPLYDQTIAERRGKHSRYGTVGPACGVVAGFVGMEALHFLTGLAKPATLGKGYSYDLRTMAVESRSVTPDPDCEVCGSLAHQDR